MTDNETMKQMLEAMKGDSDAVYNREPTERNFRLFWIIAIPGMLIANFHLLDPSSLFAHVRAVLITTIGLRGWSYIPEFLDTAEEVGLVVPEDTDSTVERLENKLEELKQEKLEEQEDEDN